MEKVCVMMSTYNGQKFLEEQVNSILNQKVSTEIEIDLHIRDDGSNDETLNILKKYRNKENIYIYFSDNIGPKESFFILIKMTKLNYDFYLFSDQDDLWKENKISKAIEKIKLSKNENENPMLYFSNVEMTDQSLNTIREKLEFWDFSFNDLLVGNAPLGCTICYTKELQKVLLQYTPKYFRMHDHWVTLVCLAVEGIIIYDDESTMLYRQHSNNVVGGTHTKTKHIKSLYKQFMNNDNIRYLQIRDLVKGYEDQLSYSLFMKLSLLLNYRGSFYNKLKIIFKKDFKTKSVAKNFLFKFAILFNKF